MNNFDILELTLVQDISQANALLKQGWKFISVETSSDQCGSTINYILGKTAD